MAIPFIGQASIHNAKEVPQEQRADSCRFTNLYARFPVLHSIADTFRGQSDLDSATFTIGLAA
jgi:hypothetical protein